MNILKRRIRFELEGGQFTHWLEPDEVRKYTVGDRYKPVKSVIIEETMSFADAMKYMGIIK
jgi:hypothetical protein